MLTKHFQLQIPTHISFTLYKNDHIDSILITRVLNECENLSKEEGVYTFDIHTFKNAILTSKRLKAEVDKMKLVGKREKFNSINFLWTIFESLINIEHVSFKISTDKEYSRIVNFNGQELVNFQYKILEGKLDLSKLLTIDELDELNVSLIESEILSNNHLDRQSFFYVETVKFLDLITNFDINFNISTVDTILDAIDPKLEEDNPILLITTDYTLY
jgi:hypothetical protein